MDNPAWVEELRKEFAEWKEAHGPTRQQRLRAILDSGTPAPVPVNPDRPTGQRFLVTPTRAHLMLTVVERLPPSGVESWARASLPQCYSRCLITHEAAAAVAAMENLLMQDDDGEQDDE